MVPGDQGLCCFVPFQNNRSLKLLKQHGDNICSFVPYENNRPLKLVVSPVSQVISFVPYENNRPLKPVVQLCTMQWCLRDTLSYLNLGYVCSC